MPRRSVLQTEAAGPQPIAMLATNTNTFTLRCAHQGSEQRGNQWFQRLEPVALGYKEDQNQRWRNRLPFGKAPVYWDERVVAAASCTAKEFSILDPGPARLRDSFDLMARQLSRELQRKALIEKDSHYAPGLAVRTRVPRLLVPGSPMENRRERNRGHHRLQDTRTDSEQERGYH